MNPSEFPSILLKFYLLYFLKLSNLYSCKEVEPFPALIYIHMQSMQFVQMFVFWSSHLKVPLISLETSLNKLKLAHSFNFFFRKNKSWTKVNFLPSSSNFICSIFWNYPPYIQGKNFNKERKKSRRKGHLRMALPITEVAFRCRMRDKIGTPYMAFIPFSFIPLVIFLTLPFLSRSAFVFSPFVQPFTGLHTL